MFTALTLSMALGAPVPPPGAPVEAGVAPRVMELKPDANGKVTVVVVRTDMRKVNVTVVGADGTPVTVEKAVPLRRVRTRPAGDRPTRTTRRARAHRTPRAPR